MIVSQTIKKFTKDISTHLCKKDINNDGKTNGKTNVFVIIIQIKSCEAMPVLFEHRHIVLLTLSLFHFSYKNNIAFLIFIKSPVIEVIGLSVTSSNNNYPSQKRLEVGFLLKIRKIGFP